MNWTALLKRQNAKRTSANGMQGCNASAFNLAPYWFGKAYLDAKGSDSEPVLRAKVFREALQACPKIAHPDALLFGEQEWFVEELPAYAKSKEEFSAVCKANRASRSFAAGYSHTIPNYDMLLSLGIEGLLEKAEKAERAPALEGMEIALKAFSEFIIDFSKAAADKESAERLARIATKPPRNFIEAVQLVWLTHVAMAIEGRGHNAFGRLDQYLLKFYNADLKAGRLDRDAALNIICHLWCMIEGMHEITNICIGGQKADGSDATNELSYICLEATKLVKSPSTNLSARFHEKSEERYHRACAEVIITGIGFPAIFNDAPCIAALTRCRIPLEDARTFGMVGCIEPMIPGRQQAWGDSRFNTPLYLLQALDELPEQGPSSYDELFKTFSRKMREALAQHVKQINQAIESFPVEKYPDPFLSALTSDCLGRSKDINGGGAEFSRMHGIAGMGLGTLADSLSAIKKLVIEDKSVAFSRLRKALKNDFADAEPLRQQLLNKAPKYGNADPYVDNIARQIVKVFSEGCFAFETCDGGQFVPGMAANIQNISAGLDVGATPDGRKAGTPLSDAASPYYGRDRKGPTAFIQSVSCPDYKDVACTVINMRFDPSYFKGPEGVKRFTSFTKSLVSKGIQELQFNFNDNETLEKAMEHPEEYAGLVVRVSGFSAYFTQLDKTVQHDILRRRAHAF